MDRETLMMIATIVAIAGVIFLFKEMNKAKQDVEGLKNFSAQIVQHLSKPIQVIEDEEEDEVEVAKTSVEKKEE